MYRKCKAEGSEFANKEIGLEVNADKPKYMIMCQDKNAGGSDNIKFDNIFFEILK